MAGILQNVFSKGLYTLADPENMSKIKQLVNHSTLYFGLIFYTAIGAWVGTDKFYYYLLMDLFFRYFNFLSSHPSWRGWRPTRQCWSRRGSSF